MQSDDQYINKPDDFSRKVGKKLREYQMPVDSDMWDSLTDRLLPRKRISAYWPWAAAGVAAVVISVLFLLNLFENDLLLTENSQSQRQIKQETVVPDIISDSIENCTDKKSDQDQIIDKNRTILKKNGETIKVPKQEKILKSEKRKQAAETVESVDVSETVEIAESTETERSEETPESEIALNQEELAKSGMKRFPAEEFLAENNISSSTHEQRGLHSLIAAFGSGGSPLDFSFGGYDADMIYEDYPPGLENNGDGSSSGGNYNLLSPEDYTDIEHRLPVSFSLTADFSISKNVSVETGLSYTYLFSRFSRNDHFIYRGTLQQHYIGVPVNLKYAVWQNNVWSVYLSGGGSIEKGLRSVYKQQIEYNGGMVHHTNVHSGIDGFQFSAQGGAGFSYWLRDNLAFFGEPRIVYYFHNNQPMSARTENPLIFGLNMGIRLQFK